MDTNNEKNQQRFGLWFFGLIFIGFTLHFTADVPSALSIETVNETQSYLLVGAKMAVCPSS